MSLDDQIREATEVLTRQLREEFDGKVNRLAEQLKSSIKLEHIAGVHRRNLEAFHQLDAAKSLSGLLDTLLTAAAADAARVVLLIAYGGRLRGWGAEGWGESLGDARALEFEPGDSGIVGEAMARRKAVLWASNGRAKAARSDTLPPFAKLPNGGTAVAVPLIVGGRAVATTYADDGGVGDQLTSTDWPAIVELVTTHAARCAEVITAARVVELVGVPEDVAASGNTVDVSGADVEGNGPVS